MTTTHTTTGDPITDNPTAIAVMPLPAPSARSSA